MTTNELIKQNGKKTEKKQPKRHISIKRFRDPIGRTVNFIAYDNYKDAPIEGFSVHFNMNDMAGGNQDLPEMVVQAALEGVNHSIGDAGALPQGATLRQKFDAMKERAEYLASGATEWASGRREGEGSILFAALMLQNPKRDPIKLRAKLKELGPSKVAAMTNKPTAEVAPFIEQVRAERGRAVNTDELFDELDSDDDSAE